MTEGSEVRTTVAVGLVVALVAGLLTLSPPTPASGQEAQDCPVVDLGTLENAPGSTLATDGRWSTEDCNSRFRADTDAHTYRFTVTDAGRVRISLSSAGADSRLYLLTDAGRRIADNDDSGARLDARIEHDLAPGTYLVEATTTGGRVGGPADFTLTISRVEGCEPVHLGTLEPGKSLTATGSWSLDTCGSRFVAAHPAHGYTFNLAGDGRVRIDLMSAGGDPVMSLVSPSGDVIGANDDGGEYRNSRIETYLQPGLYFIEATTYLERDYQPLRADFILRVTIVDEAAQQRDFNLKIEQVHTPEQVVVGDPFKVQFRVGNVGGGLPDEGSQVVLYVVGRSLNIFGRRVYDEASADTVTWRPGVSYHTGDEAMYARSVTDDRVAPFEIEFDRRGPAWVFVAVVVYNAYGREVGFHGLWHNVMVHSRPTFGPVDVRVDGVGYTVAATADSGGRVATTVNFASDSEAEIDPVARAKATYAAGVRTQLLDGIFERPAVAALPLTAGPGPARVGSPSSKDLLEAYGRLYSAAVGAAGLDKALESGQAINPLAVENMLLDSAADASASYAWIADSWRTLLKRLDSGVALSFREAFTVHSQFAHVESLIAPAVKAGEIVTAARASDEGWEDDGVQKMLAGDRSCRPGAVTLRDALGDANLGNVDDLLVLDTEMRAARPVHGMAVDSTICAVAAADRENSRFLARLSITGSDEIVEMLGLDKPYAPEPAPYRLRIVARLGDDGRVEHGVELAGGQRILPPARFLPDGARIGRWQVSGDVEVKGVAIGRIRARPLNDGSIEMGFISADGRAIVPDIARLPAELPTGIWFRSSEVEVPRAIRMDGESE